MDRDISKVTKQTETHMYLVRVLKHRLHRLELVTGAPTQGQRLSVEIADLLLHIHAVLEQHASHSQARLGNGMSNTRSGKTGQGDEHIGHGGEQTGSVGVRHDLRGEGLPHGDVVGSKG